MVVDASVSEQQQAYTWFKEAVVASSGEATPVNWAHHLLASKALDDSWETESGAAGARREGEA